MWTTVPHIERATVDLPELTVTQRTVDVLTAMLTDPTAEYTATQLAEALQLQVHAVQSVFRRLVAHRIITERVGYRYGVPTHVGEARQKHFTFPSDTAVDAARDIVDAWTPGRRAVPGPSPELIRAAARAAEEDKVWTMSEMRAAVEDGTFPRPIYLAVRRELARWRRTRPTT